MNTNDGIYVATGVWYLLSFCKSTYIRPYLDMYRQNHNTYRRYISAPENCEPITRDKWGASYTTLNGSKVRSTRELINLTKNVCNEFFDFADCGNQISLPTIQIYMERLVSGATCYRGREDYMSIKQDDWAKNNNDKYSFIYSKVPYLITPANICDALGQDIKHIHVCDICGISWYQEQNLKPDTPLNVICMDGYSKDSVYVEKIGQNMDIVNTNLCLIRPNKTGHIPASMSDLFKRKKAQIIRTPNQRISH